MKDNKANGVIIGLTSKVSQQDAFQSFLMNDKPVLTPSNLDVSMRIEYDNVKEELSKAKHDYEKVLNNAIN